MFPPIKSHHESFKIHHNWKPLCISLYFRISQQRSCVKCPFIHILPERFMSHLQQQQKNKQKPALYFKVILPTLFTIQTHYLPSFYTSLLKKKKKTTTIWTLALSRIPQPLTSHPSIHPFRYLGPLHDWRRVALVHVYKTVHPKRQSSHRPSPGAGCRGRLSWCVATIVGLVRWVLSGVDLVIKKGGKW